MRIQRVCWRRAAALGLLNCQLPGWKGKSQVLSDQWCIMHQLRQFCCSREVSLIVGLTLGIGWFRRAESKEGWLREKEMGWCFDGPWWWLAQAMASNSQSFDQRMIRHEHRLEINFHLNLIFKLRRLQTVRTFFKIRSCDFSRKKLITVSFLPVGSYRSKRVWLWLR